MRGESIIDKRFGQMEIAVLGALDRYNYGDLLFPSILRNYLPKETKEIDIKYYGLIEADFEEFSGVQIRPFSEFYSKFKDSDAKNVIIIAGGSVVGSPAGRLYSYLTDSSAMLNLCSSLCNRLHLPDPLSRMAQKELDITWGEFPLCPPKPNSRTLLIYNAVGDKFKSNRNLIENLKCADYLSVRNPNLFDALRQILDRTKLALCPDSAAVMSRIWSKDSLAGMAGGDARRIIQNYKNGYIVFQAKLNARRRIKTIRKQLNRLYHNTELPILFIPLGRAHRCEDHVFLNELTEKLDIPSQMADVTQLHDIMCLIAHSTLFIGTSLHGNVTAMSYAVPHLGITNISKLDQYLKCWDIEPNNVTGTVNLSHICDGALNVLHNADKNELRENARRLSELAENNLNTISELVSKYCNI